MRFYDMLGRKSNASFSSAFARWPRPSAYPRAFSIRSFVLGLAAASLVWSLIHARTYFALETLQASSVQVRIASEILLEQLEQQRLTSD